VAGQLVVAWLLTLPAAAAVGAAAAWLTSTGTVGTIVVALALIAAAAGIYAASRRRPINAHNVAVVVLVAFALVGLSTRQRALAGSPDDGAPTLNPGTGTAIAGLCLVAVAAIVGYRLWIIIA
jgi:hypothetical protein